MRPGWWFALLGCALSSGCFTPDGQRQASLLAPRKLFSTQLTGDDVVHLYVALVERPAGDRAMNHNVWTFINENVVDSERKELLSENGFRIGRVGSPPPALSELLRSERCCANPRHIQMRAGNPTTLSLGPAWAKCSFHIRQDGRGTPVELGQASCQFTVVPTLADGGQVKLRFTPLIKHGEVKGLPRAGRTSAGELQWEMSVSQDSADYPWLAWDVTMEPTDMLVVGTVANADDTLGHRCFVQTESRTPTQRLLVVRVGRALQEAEAEKNLSGGAPLALQAAHSARAARP
jgi:hypothetical protein